MELESIIGLAPAPALRSVQNCALECAEAYCIGYLDVSYL